MNTNEMIIGGYTLDELKKVQAAVKKDANKIISDAIETARKAMDEILDIEVIYVDDLDKDDKDYTEQVASIESDRVKVEALAAEAEENLRLADLVSGISGVEYYLPYSCDYSSDGYYRKFEDNYFDGIKAIDSMMGKLEDMESQSRSWNQSTC